MKDIKVIIDDGDQKAIITIKEAEEKDQINVNCEFVPPVDNKKETVPPVVGVAMNFLKSMKG